jgi:exodeoxyribonuclease V alpha subunit
MPKQLELFPQEEPKEESLKVDLNPLFERLAKSKFRSSFYLNAKDKEYIHDKGWQKIEQGAREIIAKRLAPAYIPNDGKQTLMRHRIFPPFIAQHATGCCCRNCLQKWHGIEKGRQLTSKEQDYIVQVIMEWLHRHY